MAKKKCLPPIVLALGLFPVAGCGWLFPGGPPEEAYVEVASTDVEQLTIVVSQNFQRFEEPSCAGEPNCPVLLIIAEADTFEVRSPYSNTFEFTDRYQILVEAFPTDEVQARVSLKVDIDDREWHDDTGLVRPTNDSGERETMRFIYQFRTNQNSNPGVR